jgi:hypothetical protein
MEKGMRPCWTDEQAPLRLGQRWNTVEYTFDADAEEAFLELIKEELKEGIVMEISIDQARFLNPVFMVKKHTKPGQKQKWRKVVDCRALNAEQRHIHFRMDGAETVQGLALQFDWATSLDLMNAFNHMKVQEAFQPFLCFMHRGRCYKYLAMPFGARHSPRIFTRALGYALAYIRAHWEVRLVAYMDDILLLHQNREYLQLATLQIATYLQCLGWTLSLEKCEFTPKQDIAFLGWRWSFNTLSLKTTSEMRNTLVASVKLWMKKTVSGEKVSWRKLGSVIGCLNFLRGQIPRASLYL